MSPENNTIAAKQVKIETMVNYLEVLFKGRSMPAEKTGKHVVLALEDTPPIMKLLSTHGCFVDLSPFSIVKNYLDHVFEGNRVDFLLVDFDIGQDLNGVDVIQIVRMVEARLKLPLVDISPNSTDAERNEEMAKAASPAVILPRENNKLCLVLQHKASQAGFFGPRPAAAVYQSVRPVQTA